MATHPASLGGFEPSVSGLRDRRTKPDCSIGTWSWPLVQPTGRVLCSGRPADNRTHRPKNSSSRGGIRTPNHSVNSRTHYLCATLECLEESWRPEALFCFVKHCLNELVFLFGSDRNFPFRRRYCHREEISTGMVSNHVTNEGNQKSYWDCFWILRSIFWRSVFRFAQHPTPMCKFS